MNRILAPTDFSNNALKAALYAAEIAVKSSAIIDFIHAPQVGDERIYQPFPLHEKYDHLVTDNSTAALKQFVGTVTNAYPSIRATMALRAGLPDDAIVEYCRHHPKHRTITTVSHLSASNVSGYYVEGRIIGWKQPGRRFGKVLH